MTPIASAPDFRSHATAARVKDAVGIQLRYFDFNTAILSGYPHLVSLDDAWGLSP